MTDQFASTQRVVRFGNTDVEGRKNVCTYEDHAYDVQDTKDRQVAATTILQPLVSVRGFPVDRCSVWIETFQLYTGNAALPTPPVAFPVDLKFCVCPNNETSSAQPSLFYTDTISLPQITSTDGIFLCQAAGVLSKGFDIWACANVNLVTSGFPLGGPAYMIRLSFVLDRKGGGIRSFITNT